MQKAFVFFLIVSFAAISAHAISRSGGGKLESVELGFEADTPEKYPRPSSLVNQGLRLWSDFVIGGAIGGAIGTTAESFVELRTIESEFPDLSKTTRSGTHDLFTTIQWVPKRHSNSCIDVYERKSATVTSVAVLWGAGRGIVVLGGVSRVATTAIDEIIATLRLQPGACAW